MHIYMYMHMGTWAPTTVAQWCNQLLFKLTFQEEVNVACISIWKEANGTVHSARHVSQVIYDWLYFCVLLTAIIITMSPKTIRATFSAVWNRANSEYICTYCCFSSFCSLKLLLKHSVVPLSQIWTRRNAISFTAFLIKVTADLRESRSGSEIIIASWIRPWMNRETKKRVPMHLITAVTKPLIRASGVITAITTTIQTCHESKDSLVYTPF